MFDWLPGSVLHDPTDGVERLHEAGRRNKDVDVFCHLKLHSLPPARQRVRVCETISGDFCSDQHASKLLPVLTTSGEILMDCRRLKGNEEEVENWRYGQLYLLASRCHSYCAVLLSPRVSRLTHLTSYCQIYKSYTKTLSKEYFMV